MRWLVLLVLMAGDAWGVELTGRVLRADTGAAVAGARVALFRPEGILGYWERQPPGSRGPGLPVADTETDAEGRYALRAPAGRYVRLVSAPGFTTEGVAEGGGERTLTLTEGHRPPEERVMLLPLASISGRLVDAESGRPVEGLVVRALSAKDGPGTLWPWATAQVDRDSGRWQVESLPPGVYALVVEEPKARPFTQAKGEPGVGYGRIYYPDAATEEGAARITIAGGQGKAGIEFRVARRPLAALTVDVAGDGPWQLEAYPEDGRALREFQTMAALGHLAGTGVAAAGRLAPGRYSVCASSMLGLGPLRRACLEVRLEGGSVSRVVLAPVEPPSATITLRYQGPGPSRPAAPPVLVQLVPATRVALAGDYSQELTGAPVERTGLLAGRYYVKVSNVPEGFGVGQVLWDGEALMGRWLEVGADSAAHRLEVVLARGNGRLRVLMRSAASPGRLMLMPEGTPAERRAADSRYALIDATGQAVFEDLEPGLYVLRRWGMEAALETVRIGRGADVRVRLGR